MKSTIESMNRKTAEFHRSTPEHSGTYGDPRDLINDLL